MKRDMDMPKRINGLSFDEVEKSRVAHGANILPRVRGKGFIGRFFENPPIFQQKI